VYRCRVCGGKGYTFLEAGNGQPTQQRTCSYCKGAGTDQWVHKNHAKAARKHDRRAMWWRIGGATYALGVVLTNGAPVFSLNGDGAVWPVVHLLVIWPLAIFCVCRLVCTSPAWRRWKADRAQAKGFTTTEERVLGTAFLAGSALKLQHDQRLRQQEAYQRQVSDWIQRHP
jgi:hypothetical protein